MSDKIPGYDVPPQMREMAERSVSEAKKAFDGFIQATHKAVGAAEGTATAAQAGTKDLNAKAVAFAEANVAAAFTFASKMIAAKDMQSLVALQTEFMQSQMKTLAEQSQSLGAAATKMMAEVTKPRA